jgi:hypothetical protein
MTDANCMRLSVQHAPHTWKSGISRRTWEYRCDGAPWDGRAQRPSVGRIVHYVSHGTPVREDGTQAFTSECRAAIVTAVIPHLPGTPDHLEAHLAVFNPTGYFFNEAVPYDPSGGGGTWHWPERAE